MLYLLFRIGNDRYALATGSIVEVLPAVRLKQMPHVMAGVAGVLNYHGTPVPVLDLSTLMLGTPVTKEPGTRLVIVDYAAGSSVHRLGLLMEGVSDTRRLSDDAFVDAGVSTTDAPYLGAVVTEESALVQRVELSELIPPALRDVLFRVARESA